MRLDELSAAVPGAEIRGDGVGRDRRASPTTAAAPARGRSSSACRARRADGHDFAPQVVEAGAAALVVERPLDLGVPEVQVADARAAMAPLAARLNGDPTRELRMTGITGTNGKTTTAFLLREVLEAAGTSTGLLGTIVQIVGGAESEVERTTPEAIDLQATFRAMLEAGDRACVMEVSSHALALRRTAEIRLRGGRLHQPDPGPPRLPRRHGRLLRRQAAAVRAGRGRAAARRDRERRRPLRTPARRRAGGRDHLLGRGRRGRRLPGRGRLLRRRRSAVPLPRTRRRGRRRAAAAGPLQRRQRARGDRRRRRPRRRARGGGRRARRSRARARAARARGRGPGVPGPRRLRAHPGLARQRAAGCAPPDRRGG